MASLSFDPLETSALFSEFMAVLDTELANHQQVTPVFGLGDFGQGFSDIAAALQAQTQLLHEANHNQIKRIIETAEAAYQEVAQFTQVDIVNAGALGGDLS